MEVILGSYENQLIFFPCLVDPFSYAASVKSTEDLLWLVNRLPPKRCIAGKCFSSRVFKIKGNPIPNTPCMEDLPTFTISFKPHVGKYGIHASFGKQTGSECSSPQKWEHIEQSNQHSVKKIQQLIIQ